MRTLHMHLMGKRKSGETVHPGRDHQSCARCGTTAEIQKIEKLKEKLKQWVVSALEIKSTQSLACVTKCEQSVKMHYMTRHGDESGSSTKVSSAKRTKFG